MASDTVPAVPPPPPHAPDPSGIPNLPGGAAQPAGQDGGWLGGVLAAVDPARPAFNLNPTDGQNDAGNATDTLTQGGSSADFHNDADPAAAGGHGASSGSQDQSVLRAFAHAAIERWRKGADARNKALDIKKERAKALQVKESRTVNRSEKFVGGNTSSGTNTSKGSDTKTSAVKKDHASGGKSSGAGRAGQGPHHGGPGRDRSPAGRGTHRAGKQSPGRGESKHGNDAGGTPKNGPSAGNGASGAGKPGPQGGTGKPGKDGKTTNSGSNAPGGPSPKPPAKLFPQDTTTQRPWKQNPDTTNPKTTPGGSGGNGGGAGINTGSGKTPAPAGGNKPADLNKKNPNLKGADKASGKTNPGTGPKTPDTKPGPATGKNNPAPARTTIDTQTSREAGYRDGIRAGKAAAHVQAYGDGVKDGWNDARHAAAADKARLDKARQQRKQQTTPPPHRPPAPPVPPKPTTPPAVPGPCTNLMKPKEQPVTTPTTTPTPVTVDHVDATHLRLGDGAARQHISRGEVRNLKQYERLLKIKSQRMHRIADGTKAVQAHATQQTQKITRLREQARTVKGGAKVLATLLKLEEAATEQARRAGVIHKRAVLGADNANVLLTNVEIRYGGMYQAVVDSDETAPAEMSFYKEGGSNG